MKTELQRIFYETIRANLGFLFAEGRFEGPYPKLDAKTGIFTVVFLGTNVAVEFILDERDEDISCKVSRMIDGQASLAYAVDAQGRLVRASLSQLLRARGIRDRLYTKVTGLSLRDQIPITLRDYARMLQTYGQMVLDDDSAFLDVR